MAERPVEIAALMEAYEAAERDARALIAGLDEAAGTWRPAPGSWSVAECLEHLATANWAYLDAMRPPAARAVEHGRLRRGPARPGPIGAWFVRTFEPPVKRWFKIRAPRMIRPRVSVPLADAAERFFSSQQDVKAFLRTYEHIDLAGVIFQSPFLRAVRPSLATGLHVLDAHTRRHLWQAWRVRHAMQK